MNIFKWYKIYRNLKNENYFYLLPKHSVFVYDGYITVMSRHTKEESSSRFLWRNLMWIRRNIEPNANRWHYVHRNFFPIQHYPNDPNFLKGV